MIAIGHLAGYAVSSIDLLKVFGKILGDSQFKQCCVIAAAALLISVGVTSWAVDERVLVSSRLVHPLLTPHVYSVHLLKLS